MYSLCLKTIMDLYWIDCYKNTCHLINYFVFDLIFIIHIIRYLYYSCICICFVINRYIYVFVINNQINIVGATQCFLFHFKDFVRNLAVKYYEMQDYENATECFRGAVKLNPTLPVLQDKVILNYVIIPRENEGI